MGSITFQGIGDASIGTKTKTYAVSDADMNRFKTWAIAYFATRPTHAVPNPPALTVTQALTAWADWCMTNTKNLVIDRERRIALTAVTPTPPFVAT
jgi:hypothetical protein